MKLNDIADVLPGNTLNRQYYNEMIVGCSSETIRCLTKDSVSNQQIYNTPERTYEYYIAEKYANSNHRDKLTLTKTNDIILKLTSPYDVAIVQKSDSNLLITNCFALIRCFDKKDIKHIFDLLSNELIISFLVKSSTSKDKRIHISELRKLPIGNDVIKCLDLFDKQQKLINYQNDRILSLLRDRKEK